jgi:hypothetical protein
MNLTNSKKGLIASKMRCNSVFCYSSKQRGIVPITVLSTLEIEPVFFPILGTIFLLAELFEKTAFIVLQEIS